MKISDKNLATCKLQILQVEFEHLYDKNYRCNKGTYFLFQVTIFQNSALATTQTR